MHAFFHRNLAVEFGSTDLDAASKPYPAGGSLRFDRNGGARSLVAGCGAALRRLRGQGPKAGPSRCIGGRAERHRSESAPSARRGARPLAAGLRWAALALPLGAFLCAAALSVSPCPGADRRRPGVEPQRSQSVRDSYRRPERRQRLAKCGAAIHHRGPERRLQAPVRCRTHPVARIASGAEGEHPPLHIRQQAGREPLRADEPDDGNRVRGQHLYRSGECRARCEHKVFRGVREHGNQGRWNRPSIRLAPDDFEQSGR